MTGINPFSVGPPGGGIAVDSSGNAYVAGYTDDSTFPHPSGNFGSGSVPSGTCTISGNTAACGEGFVAKLNPAATGSAQLVYSGFIGVASADSSALGIAVDGSGNAYITGFTTANTFPTTTGAFQTTFGGGTFDAFVAKVNSAGSALAYSTYLGGSGDESGLSGNGAGGITVDSSGNALVTGGTDSTNFPTVNPIQSALNQGSGSTCTSNNGVTRPCSDAFVSVLNAAGSSLTFSTYLGGSVDDSGSGIAVDGSGNVYVTGQAQAGPAPSFPTTPGAFQTTSTNGAAFVTEISLTTAATVAVSPASLTFSQQTVGTASAAQRVTLTNNTSSALTITSISITGTNASDFSASGSGTTCSISVSVAAGGNCAIGVSFTPSVTGSETATLNVADGAGTQTVALSGTGAAATPAVTLSPSSLTFASQPVGTTSTAQPVTLTNSGSGALSISSVTVGANFNETNTCGASVAATGSCTINVTFAPTATGSKTGTLSIADSASGSPQTVALAGTTGADFAVGLATGASYSLSVAPLGGFSQAVSLACSGAPSLATCSVSPSSVTLSGSSAASVTVNVSTTASTLAPPLGWNWPAPPVPLPAAFWLALAGLIALALAAIGACPDAGRDRWIPATRRRARLKVGATLAAMLLSMALLAGCGGGGGGGGATHSPGTPAGTYTLTVTGTSGSLRHSTTLTLIVQ